jgi:iron-sulfur cluster assembly protein
MAAITLTDRAVERIRNIRLQQGLNDDIALRLGVVGGGCSGLSYAIDFDTDPEKALKNDQRFEDRGVHVVIDMRSFLYLAGTELDYTDGLNGKGFHFNNPNASRTCSCGESFAV